ncbi:MAG TPA: MBL fold metallo-hydrolase [Verrucomicrobiae bacterium]|nr:MBL fold metallo-hydrolase [Verrucomicrobiae bacterium]
MRITKLVHSCLLIETAERVALFDPGIYSTVDPNKLSRLDDIIITHIHPDHFDLELIKGLVTRFPSVHITATDEIVERLNVETLPATSAASEGITFFDAPHEGHPPFLTPPQNIGVHYLDTISHPGDSHSFKEAKSILALPVQGPWGSTQRAVDLVLELQPKYVVPIHDWHWRDEAREGLYASLEKLFIAHKITFIKAVSGVPFEIQV